MLFGKQILDQIKLVHETEWDLMIILDAMRYDIFKQLNTIPGKLIKAESPAPHTWHWLPAMFPDKYPWTYFTAHPHIAHKPTPDRWEGYEHFDKVVPIWEQYWNDETGTVHPDDVSKVIATSQYTKAVAHYIQPHGPWIGRHRLLNPWTIRDHQHYNMMADWIVGKVKPDPYTFRVMYKDNVRLVLDSVQKNLKLFKGQVVITADHGEMLGEQGIYLHSPDYPEFAVKKLKEVPFFIVDMDKVQ